MKLEELQAAEAKLLLPTYERNPILFVDGAGMYLIDDSGERYLDLLSGIGVNALGYGHPAVTETISQQSRKLVHISNLYFHQGQAELALLLQQRHRSVGSSHEAGARLVSPEAQRRQNPRDQIPGARKQLPRAHHGS